MKIILISGISGSGKTAICKELCKDDRYHFVFSYTDRPLREKDEYGHTFVDAGYMDILLKRDDIVAQTNINGYRYCTIDSQFDEEKINVYIVDTNGINDIIKAFPQSDIMTILIRRKEIEADCIRKDRDVQVPARDDVDFIIENNSSLESAVGTINVLINFNLFNKPSHIVQSIRDKLDYIESQERYLMSIKESLYEQIWYMNEASYKRLCQYVEKKVNEKFDFDISISPDTEPDVHNGSLYFNLIAIHNGDLMWTEMHRLTECMSNYAFEFCKDNKCDDLAYNLAIFEDMED